MKLRARNFSARKCPRQLAIVGTGVENGDLVTVDDRGVSWVIATRRVLSSTKNGQNESDSNGGLGGKNMKSRNKACAGTRSRFLLVLAALAICATPTIARWFNPRRHWPTHNANGLCGEPPRLDAVRGNVISPWRLEMPNDDLLLATLNETAVT
jgi:hypothetical protein